MAEATTTTAHYHHEFPWAQMVAAYMYRMVENKFVPGSHVARREPPSAGTEQTAALEFEINFEVPWALRAVAGGAVVTMVERAVVDAVAQKLTLVCSNATWRGRLRFTQTVIYSAGQSGGCEFFKTVHVEVFSSFCPQGAVDRLTKMFQEASQQSRLEHDALARRLATEGYGGATQRVLAEIGLADAGQPAGHDAREHVKRNLRLGGTELPGMLAPLSLPETDGACLAAIGRLESTAAQLLRAAVDLS